MQEFVYVLKLQNEKIYTGKSSDPDGRYLQHKYGNGAEWTKKYKPVELLSVIPITSEHDETNITKDLMKKYGIDNVRGGPWTTVVLSEQEKSFIQKQIHSESNECYNCGQSDHFAKQCPTKVQRSNTFECYGCGETGHFVRDCPNKVEEVVFQKKNQNQDLLNMNPKILKTRKMLKKMNMNIMKKRKRIQNMDLKMMMMKQNNLRMNLKKMKIK